MHSSRVRGSRAIARMAAVALVMALVLGACFTPQQRKVTQYVNNSRSAQGVRPVSQNLQLTLKAQAWAEQLARSGRLKHSKLSAGITVRWRSLAENVGYGSSIRKVHLSYMRSPGHRANILNGRFDYIGTGWAKRGDRVYTVQVFMDY